VLAHLGVVLLLAGVAGSSSYSVVRERTLQPGQHLTVAGHTVRLLSVGRSRDARAMSTDARLQLTSGAGSPAADARSGRLVSPGLSFYPAQAMTVARPAVVSGLGGDVYLTLLSVDGHRTATLRMAVNPLVDWIWTGGALMVLGSLLALGRRRRPRLRRDDTDPAPARSQPVVLEAAGR
jgi:cytochrome c-type biogenesis protein CcmF